MKELTVYHPIYNKDSGYIQRFKEEYIYTDRGIGLWMGSIEQIFKELRKKRYVFLFENSPDKSNKRVYMRRGSG